MLHKFLGESHLSLNSQIQALLPEDIKLLVSSDTQMWSDPRGIYALCEICPAH